MKAVLISPETQTIDAIEITGEGDIAKLIGFDTLASEAFGDTGDRLYFDEECFLRSAEGRFQLDKLIPPARPLSLAAAMTVRPCRMSRWT